MDDEYLWRKSGTPDPEVARLEQLLRPYRYDPADRPLAVPASETATAGPTASAAESAIAREAVPVSEAPPMSEARPLSGPVFGGERVPGSEAATAKEVVIGTGSAESRDASSSAAPARRHDDRRPAADVHRRSRRDSPLPAPWQRAAGVALAAALLIAAAIGLWSRADRNRAVSGAYRLVGVDGRHLVRAGEEIVTGEGSTATLEIGRLGRVELQPRTRLRVESAAPENHHFYLDEGAVHATIFAEARRFQIGTPAGRSIDLGCEYSLQVGDDGASRLHVLTGQVAFEFDGREVYVPAGATCVSELGRGPHVPVFDSAAEEFKRALAEVESSPSPPAEALERVLACDQEEALSVWHLFISDGTSIELRKALYDRLSQILAKPQGVTEAGLFGGDRAMRDAWFETMKPWWKR